MFFFKSANLPTELNRPAIEYFMEFLTDNNPDLALLIDVLYVTVVYSNTEL